jgi:MFS family permease
LNALRTLILGPWRAVFVLGITQIMAWGMLWYPPVLTLPLLAEERGWSLSFAMAGFSIGLFAGGLSAPTIGRLIDAHGGHRVMAAGSLASAAGLMALATLNHPVAYFVTWAFLGVTVAATLYDAAFATLGRIFGTAARRPITLLTFAGGFASTVGWPSTLFLINHVGWRGTYFTYAALLAFVAAPLHAFGLPRMRSERPAVPAGAVQAEAAKPQASASDVVLFLLLAIAFAAFAFITSGLSAHLLGFIERGGIAATTAVTIGALFGPSQVVARLCEFIFAGNLHPLRVARIAVTFTLVAFALLLAAGMSVVTATIFAVLFGMSNGLITIGRGTVPLALFGAVGYGRLVGRLARPALVLQSVAPFALALTIELHSDQAALTVLAGCAATALAAFWFAWWRAGVRA